MHIQHLSSILAMAAGLAAAGPVVGPRAVDKLDEAATAEAQQRDDTATRAFSNVQIKASDGRCLFVDKLSGDFRANLTPIQLAACSSSSSTADDAGQGWDAITAGKHIDAASSKGGAVLVVSTLTNACLNFDPRRKAGNQLLLFSCGGRADGGGAATPSQAFTLDRETGQLRPGNGEGRCVVVKGDVLDVAACDEGDEKQRFVFGGGAGGGGGGASSAAQEVPSSTPAKGGNSKATGAQSATATAGGASSAAAATTAVLSSKTSCAPSTRTVFVTQATTPDSKPTDIALNPADPDDSDATTLAPAPPAASASGKATAIPNPTTPVPVSRAGGTLDPSAAAEAHAPDGSATRAFEGVEVRAPNGQCLFVDPTAGDFRQNLIPVRLVDCAGTDNEKWDVVTEGKHNDGAAGGALIVSKVMGGCVSLDGRRAAGDTVTVFSCGGRADGGGGTNSGQLMPFVGSTSFAFAPVAENGDTCILDGPEGRLTSGPCPIDGSQLFSIFP